MHHNYIDKYLMASPSIIMIVKDFIVLWASPAALKLFPDIIGRNMIDFVHPHFKMLSVAAFSLLVATGRGSPREILCISMGRSVKLKVNNALVNDDGSVLVVASNREELHLMENRLLDFLMRQLTDRYKDFLMMTARGYTREEIRRKFNVESVDIYPSRIMDRLRISREEYDQLVEYIRLNEFWNSKDS